MDPLHNRDSAPDEAVFELAAGSRRRLWRRIVDWMAATYGVQGEPLWSGSPDGWVLRFRRGGRALLTLVPRPGDMRAVVVIGPSAWGSVLTDELSPATRTAWESARPYPDGRWLWLSVDGDAMVSDIERLVATKSPPPRHPRARRSAAALP